MYEKLQECLTIVEDVCADREGDFPFCLQRVRMLLRDVLAEYAACEPKPIESPDDADDYCWLGATPDVTEPSK